MPHDIGEIVAEMFTPTYTYKVYKSETGLTDDDTLPNVAPAGR
jgi:hypothetical protein